MSKPPSVDIDSSVQLRLLVPHQAPRPLSATLKFRSSDPFAMTVCFRGAGESVEWVFARSLLSTAIATGFSGEGDVRVRLLVPPGAQVSAATVLRITLASPDGHAEIEADVADFRHFLERTEYVVPSGNETQFVDVDAELALLFTEQ